MLSECYLKYQKLKNNYDILWLFLWRPARETQKQNTYRRPEWSEYYEEKSLQLQIENYTCSTRLCDNKHTFGKQMPPDLAVLPALSIETIDWQNKYFSLVYVLSSDFSAKKETSQLSHNHSAMRKTLQNWHLDSLPAREVAWKSA